MGNEEVTSSMSMADAYTRSPELPSSIPRIEVWIEGLLDYFNLEYTSVWSDDMKFGFAVGKQVTGLYMIEVLLKYTREGRKRPYRQDHNLRKLFKGLPPRDRKKIEKKYKLILRSNTRSALDIERSMSALLSYLGSNPITSTRYFWERSHDNTSVMSILVAPHMLWRAIYAILIPLYGYPQRGGIRAQFNTFFVPRSKWTEGRNEGSDGSRPTRKKPDKEWLMGLRHYFGSKFPHGENDPRKLGFAIGSQIVGLYLAEMLLKYALDERTVEYDEDHNLEGLFGKLPGPEKEAVRKAYALILHSEPGHAWDFERSIDALLSYLRQDPFTESRYFWDGATVGRDGVLFAPRMLVPMIDALFTALHGIHLIPKENEHYDRNFESFEGSFKEGPGPAPAAR